MKKNVKVILLKDVPELGQTDEVKEVSLGYARNFLVPRGLAIEASEKQVADLEVRKAKKAASAEADLKHMEELVQKLEGQTVEIAAKASEEGTLYGSVSAAKIASALKDKGLEVKKEQILAEHIKELGEHEVVINLDHGLEARITLIINPEKK
jgi:large subunit ribosomal protein L9